MLAEASEESGSCDLPAHIEALAPRLGQVGLVICLDSGCADYEHLWVTTSLRGLVNGTTNGPAGTMVVRGQAPLSELAGYQSRLNAMTSGQGRYTIALSHYEAVPPGVQQQLVSQHQVKDED